MIRLTKSFAIAMLVLCVNVDKAGAQYSCRFFKQFPTEITVEKGKVFEREVEIDFTNTGSSGWQRTGGVSNLSYIELRPCNSGGSLIEGPLYHSNWINRMRVGSFLYLQNGVSAGQVARFVFMIRADGTALSAGLHYFYFRPYHASGHYISDWGQTKIAVRVVDPFNQPPPPPPLEESEPVEDPPPNDPPPLEESEPVEDPPPNDPPAQDIEPYISSVVVERTKISDQYQGGSRTEEYDLVAQSPIKLRLYQQVKLVAGVRNGNASAFEWSLMQNGNAKNIGTAFVSYTKPEDLSVGYQTLRLRLRNLSGQWTDYARFPIEVEYWPKLKYPLNREWVRNGNDYNRGGHVGQRSLYAQDWNDPVPGTADFGREIVAALSGTARVNVDTKGGNYISIESAFNSYSVEFRTLYFHLSSVLIKNDEFVQQGEPIGLCGTTGTWSSGSHLHFVLQKKINGSWVSVAPEPVWVNDNEVHQTTPYDMRINSDNRRLPESKIILSEHATGSISTGVVGWGHSKAWADTVSGSQPTARADWEVDLPLTGTWEIMMHNPTGITNDPNGIETHNSTNKAVFELMRSGKPGMDAFSVNQAGSKKGALIKVAEFDGRQGERVMLTQHNATGETGKKMTFDEVMLVLKDSGGNGDDNPNPPQQDPVSDPTTPSVADPSEEDDNQETDIIDSPPSSSTLPPQTEGGCTLGAVNANLDWIVGGYLMMICFITGVVRLRFAPGRLR